MTQDEPNPLTPLDFEEVKTRAGLMLSDLGAVMAMPSPARENELASRGLYPVAVVHGGPESDAEMTKISMLTVIARQLGTVPLISGGNDYHVYVFEDPAGQEAAQRFADFVRGEIAESWWRITRTGAPDYGRR